MDDTGGVKRGNLALILIILILVSILWIWTILSTTGNLDKLMHLGDEPSSKIGSAVTVEILPLESGEVNKEETPDGNQ